MVNKVEEATAKKVAQGKGILCPSCKQFFANRKAVAVYKCNNCGYKQEAQTGEAKQGIFPVMRGK